MGYTIMGYQFQTTNVDSWIDIKPDKNNTIVWGIEWGDRGLFKKHGE
jgi:hypothetical protein